jgi:hypothetical protein
MSSGKIPPEDERLGVHVRSPSGELALTAFLDGRGEALRDQSCGGALGFALAWTAEAAIATWSPIAEFAGVMLDRGAGVTYIGGT